MSELPVSKTVTATSRHLIPLVALTALAHLVLEICQQFLPVIFPVLIATRGFTYEQVGTLMLMHAVGSLSQPLFGYLSDRWSPRLMVALSVAWIGALMGLIGLIGSYWLLLVVAGLGALGSGAFHPAGASITSASAGQNRGTAMSIFSFSGTLGSAISPLLISLGLVWVGLPGTTILIPLALVTSLFLLLQFRAHPRPQPFKAASESNTHTSIVASGSRIALGLIVVIVAARSWLQGTMMAYLPEWLQRNDYSLEAAGAMLSLLLIMVSIGTLIGGPLSDRVGRLPIMIASLVLLVPAQWLFLVSASALTIVAVSLIGLLIGMSFPVGIVMAQEAWPRSIGLASAMVMGLGWLPAGIGPWFTGMLADQTSLAVALGTLIYAPLVGIAATVVLIIVQRGRRV